MLEKCKKLYLAHEEIINYLIIGVLTTIVSWTAKFICAATFLDADIPWQNMVLSFINWTAGVIFAYFTNRKFVFKSHEKDMVREAAKFVASRISTLILDMVVMFVMVNVMDLNFIFSTLVSAVLVMIGNYVFSKLFVFNKKAEAENGEA